MAKRQANTFEDLLTNFENHMRLEEKKEGTIENYISHLKQINGDTNTVTTWLKEVKHENNPIKCLCALYDEQYSNRNWKSALILFGKFVFGKINAQVNLASIKDFDRIACELIAQSAIFCSREVFNKVQAGELGDEKNTQKKDRTPNQEGAWFHHTTRRKTDDDKKKYENEFKKERRPTVTDETWGKIRLDDNTFANEAIKRAILEGLDNPDSYGKDKSIFKGFEACHIWDKTCYDVRYHTSVANLVLLPRPLAGLTDHCDAVKKLLQYEAWRRFGFKPDEDCYYKHYHETNPDIISSHFLPNPKYYDKVKWKYPESNYTNP